MTVSYVKGLKLLEKWQKGRRNRSLKLSFQVSDAEGHVQSLSLLTQRGPHGPKRRRIFGAAKENPTTEIETSLEDG